MCDDDISGLSPGWNRDLIYRLRESRELFGISARLMNPDGTVGRNSAGHFDLASPLAKVDMIPTACCVFRKTDLRFDERYIRAGWEDTDFFMQALRKYGGRFAIANTIRVLHLNEEKNGGGVENEHNRRLFLSKWDFVEADGLDGQSQCDGPPPSSSGTVLNCRLSLSALYEAVMADLTDMEAFKSFIQRSYGSRCFHLLESCLKELVKTRSSSKEICYLLASCLFEQAKYDEARPVAVDLASRYPGYAPARSLLERIETMGQQGAPRVPSGTSWDPGGGANETNFGEFDRGRTAWR